MKGLIFSKPYSINWVFTLPALNIKQIGQILHNFKRVVNIKVQELLDRPILVGSYSAYEYCHTCRFLFTNKKSEWRIGYAYEEDVARHLDCKFLAKSSTRAFTINYKRGTQIFGEKHLRDITDHYNKNQADYLQPEKWNNVTRKMEINPDFIKVYGDPTKKDLSKTVGTKL